jgi:hypothetical protein
MDTSANNGNGIQKFFKEHGANVMTGVIIIITLLVLFDILGVNFDPIRNTHIQKVVTVEKFTDASDEADALNTKNPSAICESGYSLDEKDKICRNLIKKNCVLTDCCGWLVEKDKDGVCVGGNVNGPTYHENEDNKEIILTEWIHRSAATSS